MVRSTVPPPVVSRSRPARGTRRRDQGRAPGLRSAGAVGWSAQDLRRRAGVGGAGCSSGRGGELVVEGGQGGVQGLQGGLGGEEAGRFRLGAVAEAPADLGEVAGGEAEEGPGGDEFVRRCGGEGAGLADAEG